MSRTTPSVSTLDTTDFRASVGYTSHYFREIGWPLGIRVSEHMKKSSYVVRIPRDWQNMLGTDNIEYIE